MNDTNTNKADDMNEDDVTLTGSEGENTAVESDAAADATADTATESPDAAGASDSTTVPDSVQFSIVFDDDGDDSDAIVIDAADAEIDTTAEADTTVATDGSAEEAPADDEKPGDDTQDAAAQEPASADNTADNTSADTGDADTGTTAADTADENLDVAAANASKVNETLKLSTGARWPVMARRRPGPAGSPWHRPASTLQCVCHRASTRSSSAARRTASVSSPTRRSR